MMAMGGGGGRYAADSDDILIQFTKEGKKRQKKGRLRCVAMRLGWNWKDENKLSSRLFGHNNVDFELDCVFSSSQEKHWSGFRTQIR